MYIGTRIARQREHVRVLCARVPSQNSLLNGNIIHTSVCLLPRHIDARHHAGIFAIPNAMD